MKYKAVTLGLVLAGTALGSAALTLGRARGAAWIGQPLELVVPLQIEAGQADGGLCAQADVFYGDSRQDGNRIQVQASPADQPNTFNLKINSPALIDEPVVSVYLRAGCNQKSSRKYVLLADFPNDIAPSTVSLSMPPAPQVPLVIPQENAPTAPVAPSGSAALPIEVPPTSINVPPASAGATPSPAPQIQQNRLEAPLSSNADKAPVKEVVKEVVKEAVKPPPVAQAAKPRPAKREEKAAAPKTPKPAAPKAAANSESAGKPRLRLDPIETLSERVKTLESTTVATSLQEDLARDGQRMEQLQTDLRSLLDQAVKNEAALAAMRERLEKAEAERVPVSVVYGLLALVVLAMGALAFLWAKRPRQRVSDQQRPTGQQSHEPSSPRAPTSTKDIDIDL